MIKMQKTLHLHIEQAKKRSKVEGQYMMFEKHDGWYGTLDVPECHIRSSAGRIIPSLREFAWDLGSRCRERGITNGRLIFEIMIHGLEYNSFPKLNGILNRDEVAEDVYLRVHDWLPNYKGDMIAHSRYKFAEEIVAKIDAPNVIMSPMLGTSQGPAVWVASARRIIEKGGEGLIMKQCEAVYHAGKRNHTLLKIKEDMTLDLLVTKITEGEGKFKGMVGSITVKERNGMEHTVGGMTDDQRLDWFIDHKIIIGRVVEVKAMKRLENGSLREPRFKAIRWDKGAQDID